MRTALLARRAARAALVLATGSALACGDTAPLSAPERLSPQTAALSRSGHRQRVRVPILHRINPLRADEVACRTIDPAAIAGSVSIALPEAGLRVSFPEGSIPSTTQVCLTAHAGSLLTYSFQPHGLQFGVPVQVLQDLRGTTAYNDRVMARTMIAGYLSAGVQADVDDQGVGTFAETFSTAMYDDAEKPTKTAPASVTFSTVHFSGYALASGRADSLMTR
ncbi:MAG TPA: hypothetical protein VGG84_16685 [Gemmatimonadaceae bacterium]|jgi:hypothetical protein